MGRIFKCANCGTEIDESELKVVRDYEEGWLASEYYETTCPCCECELEVAVKCDMCGEWVAESLVEDGMCEECYEKYGDKEE